MPKNDDIKSLLDVSMNLWNDKNMGKRNENILYRLR